MNENHDNFPDCFGDLETVFPMDGTGLRNTPENCMACEYKTDCLKAAMSGKEGDKLKEEHIDRAYEGGMINFFQRWSRKKLIKRIKD